MDTKSSYLHPQGYIPTVFPCQEQVTHLFRDLGYVLWDAQAIAEAAQEAQIQEMLGGKCLDGRLYTYIYIYVHIIEIL